MSSDREDWGTNPGTKLARDAGCICPVMDNWQGNPEIGRIRGFVMVVGCPLHSPEVDA
jgi:hypothetical protein